MLPDNLHIYPSTFKHETRMLKETRTLAESGQFRTIHIAAIWAEGLPEEESIDPKRTVWRARMGIKSLIPGTLGKALGFIEWGSRILWKHKSSKIGVVSCHCLAVLPIGIVFKIFKRSRIVYEAHELETERHGWSSVVKKIAKVLEKLCMPFVDQTVVVGPSIARWYENVYRINTVTVVRNVPYRPKTELTPQNTLRAKYNLLENDVLYIYQGIMNSGRSIQILLDVFSKMSADKHLVFLGYGPLEKDIKEYAEKFSNIHYHPAVAPETVLSVTQEADAGLALFENTSLSYFYSCPNKLFEYIMAGLPCVVSDFPDMAQIVNEFDCGWSLEIVPETIWKFISLKTRSEILSKRRHVLIAREKLGWEDEELKLLKCYDLCLAA